MPRVPHCIQPYRHKTPTYAGCKVTKTTIPDLSRFCGVSREDLGRFEGQYILLSKTHDIPGPDKNTFVFIPAETFEREYERTYINVEKVI